MEVCAGIVRTAERSDSECMAVSEAVAVVVAGGRAECLLLLKIAAALEAAGTAVAAVAAVVSTAADKLTEVDRE